MWVKSISIYTNIISFQRLFPILLILNILCKHTQHASFFSQTRLPILFSSSPLHGLIVDETRNCMTVKKKEEREREKKEERTVQACFIFHACFAIRNLCGHAFRLFSLHTLITHRFSTLYYSSISISIYRADCVSAEEIVAGICTALSTAENVSVCVREREQFGPLFISMVSSSIRIAYKSKSNPISKIIIRLMAKNFENISILK